MPEDADVGLTSNPTIFEKAIADGDAHDAQLREVLEHETDGHDELRSRLGIANAKLAYQQHREAFAGARWDRLKAAGARPQRCLWASTSVKDPRSPDTMYVEPLAGTETVNTMPPETLSAVQDHGTISGQTIDRNLEDALGICLSRCLAEPSAGSLSGRCPIKEEICDSEN